MNTPRQRRFVQCDVFTAIPTRGNALAVVVDADGLDDEQMRLFARWTNLAETTFLLPPDHPDADYRVRIFTPSREMPFAGHPTLGSCMAWLDSGGQPATPGVVRQQCPVGIVDIDVSGEVPAFTAPPTTIAPMQAATRERIVRQLCLSPECVIATAELDNGPVWQVFELASAEDVLAVDSSRVRYPDYAPIGLIGRHAPGGDCDYEVRMLAPSSGMSEDPITGSLNAAIAHWLRAGGRLTSALTIAQGTKIDRAGRVSIVPSADGDVRIGGGVHILIRGSVLL